MKKLTILYSVFILFLFIEKGYGCPCGCGAVNPQVMYPGESFKLALSLNRDSSFKTINSDGDISSEYGPDVRDTFTIAAAKAFTNTLSSTISIPIQTNRRKNQGSTTGLSDPTISMRWTALPQSFTNPYIPQVQVFTSYKHSFARSMSESRQEYFMDVFGNGYSEMVPGIDLWWGMEEAKFGFSQVAILPFDSEVVLDGTDEIYTRNEGKALKSTFLAGYNFIGTGYVIGSYDFEKREEPTKDGKKIDGEDKLINSLGLSTSLKVGFKKTVGVAWRRTAALLKNKNTTRADSVAFSYMEAF